MENKIKIQNTCTYIPVFPRVFRVIQENYKGNQKIDLPNVSTGQSLPPETILEVDDRRTVYGRKVFSKQEI